MSDSAITVIVSGTVQAIVLVVGFLTLWIKLRYGVEDKIDLNTKLTKAGTTEAANSAQLAALRSTDAKAAADELRKTLNGALDKRIEEAVKLAVVGALQEMENRK